MLSRITRNNILGWVAALVKWEWHYWFGCCPFVTVVTNSFVHGTPRVRATDSAMSPIQAGVFTRTFLLVGMYGEPVSNGRQSSGTALTPSCCDWLKGITRAVYLKSVLGNSSNQSSTTALVHVKQCKCIDCSERQAFLT